MPGWHDEVKDLVQGDKLVLLGVTQEQHAERCRLFAQWHGFTWPIVQDSINVLGSAAVPITIAIDEYGIVRSTRPKPEWLRDTFLTTNYPKPDSESPKARKPNLKQLAAIAAKENSSAAFRHLGDAYSLWSSDPTKAVDAYNSALQQDQDSALNHFRLGVALRRRHDSLQRQQSDFPRAVSHWTAALSKNPNQYIWRRRIQQYGPRLGKPYPFYDWVPQAVEAIEERGETPIALKVPLSGAEIARPLKTFPSPAAEVSSPDPTNRITRDVREYVAMNIATVPAYVRAGESVRLHLEFSLLKKGIHWNNEAEPLRVWLESPKGWTVAQALLTHDLQTNAAESSEVRRIEVEIKASQDASDKPMKGFALYYICDDATGECLLRRQDLALQLKCSP